MTREMNHSRFASRARARLALPLLVALTALAALVLPAAASAAIQLQIADQGNHHPDEVWVTIYAPNPHGDEFEVPTWTDNVAKKLSEIPGGEITIEKLISGRVFISYDGPIDGVTLPFDSPEARFDWAELTVTPAPGDTANLTAVDQFAIGMRLEALNEFGQTLETLGEANSDTIFNALQQIPGGPQSTIRNSKGEIVRVLSPQHSTAYPLLSEYVNSLVGQTLTLHTALDQTPEGVSEYSGAVAPDGSIALHGTYESSAPLAEPPPPTIEIPAAQLLAEIYSPTSKHNNFEDAIRRDLLAAFSIGLWGGRYGNDALSFCANPGPKLKGLVCPEGFNQPAFGDARTSFPLFPTCNQYAAVINQYSDSYGSAYSDASKKVSVGLDQAKTKTLRLTILPDSGSAMPVNSGNPNCGAAAPAPAPAPTSAGANSARPKVHFVKKAKVKKGKVRVARLRCGTACGQIKAVAKRGKTVVAKVKRGKVKAAKPWVVLHLTKQGKRMLERSHRLVARVNLFVRPAGGSWSRYHHKVKLIAPR